MEMGIGQAAKLWNILEDTHSFGDIEIVKDLAGIERVIVVRKK
jgi:methylase of polypeptide subunit release factors